MSTHSNDLPGEGNDARPGITTEQGITADQGITASQGPAGGPPAPRRGRGDRPAVPRTRAGETWGALTVGMVLLIVVLIFILQNLKSVRVHFLWVTWTIPLAVDLLLATVLGGLIMFSAGSLRILQLRRLAKRNARDVDLPRDGHPVR